MILVILDIQGKLSQIVQQLEEVLHDSRTVIEGCKTLDIPPIWVEQMLDKLGATHPQIAEVLVGETPITKSSLSAYGKEALVSRLGRYDSKHVVLAGTETHICIYQTAIDLLAAGYKVTVIASAVSSHTESNKQIGLNMLHDAGAQLLSTEALLFSILRIAAHLKFKKITKSVK